MERCFRRKLKQENSNKRSRRGLGSQIRSISIDLSSNKENLRDNANRMSHDLSKNRGNKRVKKGQIQCSIDNKIIDIDVKKNEKPYEIARRVLLKNGLGLGYLDQLSENIRKFQSKIFDSG